MLGPLLVAELRFLLGRFSGGETCHSVEELSSNRGVESTWLLVDEGVG